MSFDPRERRFDLLGVGAPLVDHLRHGDVALVYELGLRPHVTTLVGEEQKEALAARLGPGTQVSGGTVANTVAGVASLGGVPVYVGAVANDELGARYADDLVAAGVTARLQTVRAEESGAMTGCCYVVVDPNGERTMATYLGVSGLLDPSAIDEEDLASAQIAYFDGYLLDFPHDKAILSRLFELSRRSGTKVAMGLGDPLVVERHHVELAELVGLVDVVFANEQEALGLGFGRDASSAVEALLRPSLTVAVTRGAKGAIVADEYDTIEIPAVPVGEVVDVTGAGDQFAAGMCFGLARGLGLQVSGELGALAAAEVIGHLGARPEAALSSLAASEGLLS